MLLKEKNRNLLIKDNSADMVLRIVVINYDGTQKGMMVLFDSEDDWQRISNSENPIMVLPTFAAIVLKFLQHDALAKVFYAELSQVINGEFEDVIRMQPFVRDGKRFRRAKVEIDGTLSFEPEDEII